MADSIGILAQAIISNAASPPGATVIYTVPQNTQTSISSIVICNQDGSARTVDIAALGRPSDIDIGTSVPSKCYLFKGLSVAANTTKLISPGVTLNQFNAIAVQASASDVVSINIFGIENSQ
tara:strand:+ start:415 stop:780 length:366 start_codon:yes stop_codon:yes gene_type:complete